MVMVVPTGIESRSPTGRSAAAMQMRCSAWGRKSCADSPVWSLERLQDGLGGAHQAVLADGGGELQEPPTKDEGPAGVASDEVVVLEREGEAVDRGAGEVGARHEVREGRGALLEFREDGRGLVNDANSAMIVHGPILASYIVRFKPEPGGN